MICLNTNENFVELDVREDLRLKKEPFDKIMGAVKELQDDGALVLHSPFNPIPLHTVLKRKGYQYEAVKMGKKHRKVIYTKREVSE